MQTDKLNKVISYLDDARGTIDGSAVMTPVQRAARDIRHSFLVTYLKGSVISESTIKHIMDTVLPGTSLKSDALVHYSSAVRNQFRVDLAHLLVTRDASFQQCDVKLSWTDSSPQGY